MSTKNENEKKTDWKSMWISIFLQLINGIQFSVYFMSMWPYLSGLDSTASIDFLGLIIAVYSIGWTVANPIFGMWNQKTMSVKWPTITGFVIVAIGQLWYAFLELMPSNVKWYMLAARFITGIGAGHISALRAYGAMASTTEDRMKAISLGTGGLVLGISFGPVISAIFTPIGEQGWCIGSLRFNMYSVTAIVMVLICILSCFLVFFWFEESYVGIVDLEEEGNENLIVPKFDIASSMVCIYLFMIVGLVATNIEVMSTPLSTALYDWKDSDSIFYNGIALGLSSVISVVGNVVLATTWVGKTDKRRQIFLGMIFFLLYHVFMYPWSFYSGPLNYLPEGMNTTLIGGCHHSYSWCSTTTRVPLFIYMFCFIFFFGIAFPLIEAPAAALFSEIIGPRKQGFMQGVFSVGGSIAPVIASITSTTLFKHTGYRYVILSQMLILLIGLGLIVIFYKRMVPLKVIRKDGEKIAIDK